MMIYPQKNRQSKKGAYLISIICVVLIVTTAFCLQIFAGGATSRFALTVGRPFSVSYRAVADHLIFATAFLRSRTSLVNENKELKTVIETNAAKLARFDAIFHEHQDLLDAYSRSPFAGKTILANVISKPPQSLYDVLIVDAGSDQGVRVGNTVYGIGGIPIGQVAEVARSTSKVVMFSSVGQDNQVVSERTGASLTVTGTGGGNLEAEVAQEFDIVVGDTLVLPEFGGAFVASTVSVDSNVASAFKKVLFRVPVSVFNLRWVEIHD